MNELITILEDSGWYEGRRIDTDYIIEDLVREGFNKPNNLIIDLLSQYWNLEINFITPDNQMSNIKIKRGRGFGSRFRNYR